MVFLVKIRVLDGRESRKRPQMCLGIGITGTVIYDDNKPIPIIDKPNTGCFGSYIFPVKTVIFGLGSFLRFYSFPGIPTTIIIYVQTNRLKDKIQLSVTV